MDIYIYMYVIRKQRSPNIPCGDEFNQEYYVSNLCREYVPRYMNAIDFINSDKSFHGSEQYVGIMTVPLQGGEQEKKEYRHKTLSAYYPHLYTLHDYLLSAPRSSTSAIISATDSDEYKRLIRETVCACRLPPQDLPSKGEVWGTQQEIVNRVLGEVARRCAREGIKDVLISSDKVSYSLPYFCWTS